MSKKNESKNHSPLQQTAHTLCSMCATRNAIGAKILNVRKTCSNLREPRRHVKCDCNHNTMAVKETKDRLLRCAPYITVVANVRQSTNDAEFT